MNVLRQSHAILPCGRKDARPPAVGRQPADAGRNVHVRVTNTFHSERLDRESGRQRSPPLVTIRLAMAEPVRPPPFASHTVSFRVTLTLVGLFAAVTLALLPFAREPGPAMAGFNAAFAAGVFVAELATSFLLLVVLRQTLRPSVLLLATAYLYSALMALAYMMAYPSAIAAGRILVGGPQTVSWIYNSWIFGFALMTFAAVLLELGSARRFERERALGIAYAGNVFAAGLATLLIVVFSTQSEELPPLVAGNSWTLLNAGFNYGGVLLLSAGVALILLRLGRRNDLFLWLSLAMMTIAFGNLLSAAGGGRYTVGWYACRSSWVVSSSVLLLYFLGQFVRQHGQLARTTGDLEERTRERDRIWSVSEDLLGVSTFDGYFIALNPAWSRMLGWTEGEVRRQHVDQLRHPDDAEASRAARARLAAGVPTVRIENRFRHNGPPCHHRKGSAGRVAQGRSRRRPRPEDGGARPAHRRRGARFQQPADDRERLHSAAQGTRAGRRPSARSRAGDRDRRPARRLAHPPAPELRASPADQPDRRQGQRPHRHVARPAHGDGRAADRAHRRSRPRHLAGHRRRQRIRAGAAEPGA
ncbi:MAG: PAS domain S-box protein [Alphaproteobacteria bacterium]|nr:MAG: PAS domain S-box protein [Alphaproteobacteria bacterium]